MIKTYNIILIILLFVSSSLQLNLKSKSFSSAAPYPANYFDGDWDGTGYTCQTSNPTPITKVNIVTSGGKVKSTKVTGDACVNAGHQTFIFDVLESVNIPGNYKCNITLGSAWRPQSSSSNN